MFLVIYLCYQPIENFEARHYFVGYADPAEGHCQSNVCAPVPHAHQDHLIYIYAAMIQCANIVRSQHLTPSSPSDILVLHFINSTLESMTDQTRVCATACRCLPVCLKFISSTPSPKTNVIVRPNRSASSTKASSSAHAQASEFAFS